MPPFFLSEITEVEKPSLFPLQKFSEWPCWLQGRTEEGKQNCLRKKKKCSLKKIVSVSKYAVCVSIHFHILSCSPTHITEGTRHYYNILGVIKC